MAKRRRRVKHTTTLAERLREESGRLREQAKSLAPGVEQTLLLRKIRQNEAALRIDEWLASPRYHPSSTAVNLMSKGDKRRPARKLEHQSD